MRRFGLLWMLMGIGLWAQSPPDTLWLRHFGGNGEESAVGLAPVHDGGWVFTGHTRSFGAGALDLYLVRLTAEGETLWSRAFGGPDDDLGTAVVETPDHGFLAVGYTYSSGAGNDDVYLVRTDSLGQLLWSQTVGGPSADEAYDVVCLGSQGFLVAGRTYSFGAGNFDVYLVRLNAQGDTLWTRTYGDWITDGAFSVVPTTDGGFALVGYTYMANTNSYDAYVVKVDSLGTVLWQHTYGGSDDDVATAAVELPSGGLLVVGYTYTFTQGSDDLYFLRLRADGTLQEFHHAGGAGRDEAWAVVPWGGHQYLVAGLTGSQGAGGLDGALWLVDTLGAVLTGVTYGGLGDDGLRSVAFNGTRWAASGFTEVAEPSDYDALVLALQGGVAVAEQTSPGRRWKGRWDPQGKLWLQADPPVFGEIHAYDATGRHLAVVWRGWLRQRSVQWHPGHPGVYFLRFQGLGVQRTWKVWVP